MIKDKYNGRYIPLFILDNSNVHTKKAANQLNASVMNVGPGGKQPYMRPGWYMKDGVRIEQEMVFSSGPHCGKQKGMRAVVEERI